MPFPSFAVFVSPKTRRNNGARSSDSPRFVCVFTIKCERVFAGNSLTEPFVCP